MKQFLFYPLFFTLTLGKNETPIASHIPNAAEKKTAAFPVPAQGAELNGEWELVGYALDANDNKQLDEAERKNLKPAGYKDYMKLNPDGSGLFTVARLEGRYEALAKQSTDKKFLTWYDKSNSRHRVGTIVTVSKNELHIKEPGGSGLFVWKRL